jgi:hypothetical protein
MKSGYSTSLGRWKSSPEEGAGVMDLLLLRLLGALEEDSIDTHKWYAKQFLIQWSTSRQDNRGRRAYLGIRQESSLVYLIYGRAWKKSEAHRFHSLFRRA